MLLHAAWWALLPNVTKPTLPKHLRPIGLSEVSSRVIGKVLQCRLRPHVETYLRDLPQWAYTPGRGTLDAALRVQAHCQQVMQECQPNRWTVRQARAGLPRPLHQVGGLQLSLDLSAAFDTLEWCHIADALRDADIPTELQAHIKEWHRNIKYHLEIQGQHVEIAASRGIKQACLVAPLVWSLVTGRFLYLLALETDPLWVAQDVTAYADDFHAGSRVTNVRGLECLLYRLGCLLDILAQAGLNVNASKSAILYRFKGAFARTWLRQHIRTTPDGDLFRLRTPAGALYEFPVVSTHTYLGTRISYHEPRVQTLRHRMQLAQVEWSRLRKLVCSKRGLYLEDRIRIWRSSVPATLLYGLAASGLPTGGLAAIRTVYMRQLRAIMRCPAHLSKLSNRAVLRKAGVPEIGRLLCQEMVRLATNVQVLSGQDSVLVTPGLLRHAQGLPDTLYHLPGPTVMADTVAAESSEQLYSCRFCSQYFATHALCRAHESRQHQQRSDLTAGPAFCRYTHGLDGMPTCRLCHHPFRKWGNLAKHISRNQCPVLTGHRPLVVCNPPGLPEPLTPSAPVQVETPASAVTQASPPSAPQPGVQAPSSGTRTVSVPSSAQPLVLPLVQRSEVQDILRQSHWHDLLSLPLMRDELSHHCPFYRQWCMDVAAIKRHMTQQHPDGLARSLL